MKQLLKLCSLVAIATVVAASMFGGKANAVSGGTNATQTYGAVSLWFPGDTGIVRHRCGAALISSQWAVTAAHCQFLLVPGKTQVRVGSVNNADPQQYEEVGLAQVFINPGFKEPDGDAPTLNDIALIKFQRPVTKPTPQLALPEFSPPVGTQGTVAGWGWICDDTVGLPGAQPNCGLPFTNILQQLALQIAPDSRCEFMGNPATDLCLIAANGKHAMACRGDSGTPVVLDMEQFHVLVGTIVGDGDQVIGHPNECDENVHGDQGTGTATDVSVFTDWIRTTISQNATGTNAEKAAQMPQIYTH